MRHLLTVIVGTIIFITLFMGVDWKNIDFSLSTPTFANEARKENVGEYKPDEYLKKLWIDTLMYAAGHSFGYEGDVSMWGGWYWDTIPVGDDIMLSCDSVGPSSLRFSLVTKELIVDFCDPKAPDKIRNFMNPISGFKRYQNSYEEVLDSIVTDDYGTLKCIGSFSSCIDYADSSTDNADKINRFICDLTGISQIEMAKVPGFSAFYAGFNPRKNYRPVYTGNVDNMKSLSDFLANKTFENWIRGGDTDESSNDAKLEIRSHIVNSKFITVSVYEYERIGIGHGMYSECFSTLDISSGARLTNNTLFKSNTLDKVKKELFEVMAKDANYLAWNQGVESAAEIEAIIEGWQSPNPALEGTEWEEPKKESKFELPEGALTESGVVFSFQPYEIDCWAAGAYHFVVPYEKLNPYLTKNAKSLIEGATF